MTPKCIATRCKADFVIISNCTSMIFMVKKRVTITLDEELYNALRQKQAEQISKTNDSNSLSQQINIVLREGFRLC